MCVSGGIPALNTHSEPHAHTSRSASRDAFFEAQAAARAVLEKKVGVVAASAQCDAQKLPADFSVDARKPAGGKRRAVGYARSHNQHRTCSGPLDPASASWQRVTLRQNDAAFTDSAVSRRNETELRDL